MDLVVAAQIFLAIFTVVLAFGAGGAAALFLIMFSMHKFEEWEEQQIWKKKK